MLKANILIKITNIFCNTMFSNLDICVIPRII